MLTRIPFRQMLWGCSIFMGVVLSVFLVSAAVERPIAAQEDVPTVIPSLETDTRDEPYEPGLPEQSPDAPSTINPNVTALQIAQAIARQGVIINSARFVTTPPIANTANGVIDSPLTFFPQDGTTFGILTTGRATTTGDPGAFANTELNGGNFRGNTDYDVTVLEIELTVPQGANCLSIDFQFLSEEYPRYVGTPYNDAFIAELDISNWTTSGSTISAPNNFAFDPDGRVVSINSTGIARMQPANGRGTAYDGGLTLGGNTDGAATVLLRASKPVTPGVHKLYLSIFDQGDRLLDSAVLLDNLFVGTLSANQCQPGVIIPPTNTPTFTPTATRTPTRTATPTATATPGPTATRVYPTATASPSFGACTVSVEKVAYPATARIDGQVGVTLRMSGACPSEIGSAVDVALVLDRSSSMCGDKLNQAQTAGQAFLDSMAFPPDQASIISFAAVAQTHSQLTGNRQQAKNALNNIICGGLSRIDTGLNQAREELTSMRRVAGHTAVVILLTDGNPEGAYASEVRTAAQRLREERILLYTIGLGADINASLLREIATQPEYYFQSPTPAELAQIYLRLAGELRDVPAANIVVTDIVGTAFEIVPGSFTGAATPQVNGQTLTWSIARLAQGPTELSFSVRPKACGTFAVNQSARMDYDDNRGVRRSVTFPVASVTIDGCSGRPYDAFIRDNGSDTGDIPTFAPWWESPDIWVRRLDDSGTQHQNPQAGQVNFIYARVHNRGTQTITNVDVTFYYANAATGLQWPGDWNSVASRRIASIPAGGFMVVSIPWNVPNLPGHYCLFVRITAPDDPIRDVRVQWENNIGQRNLNIIDYPQPPAGRCEFDSNNRQIDRVSFEVINVLSAATVLDLQITVNNLASEAEVRITPGALAGRWSSLDGLVVQPDGRLLVTRFPAIIYGVRLNPQERRTLAVEIAAPVNSRFTIALTQYVRGQVVGGNSYQRWLPPCPIRLPLIMKQPSTGAITGRVVNAVNNQGIGGAQVCVIAGSRCTTTDSNGNYTLLNIPAGTQEVRASATGFVTDTQTVIVQAGATKTVNFALSPTLAQGEIRVVLTWGVAPRDLDSHLWLPASRAFHVYFANMGNCNAHPYACLDVDDVTSYGPETITIRQRYQGRYVYAVYNYSGESAITGSNGRVRVYGSSGLVADYQVPTSGSGRWWYVFDLDGATGAITTRNYITGSSPGPYSMPEGADSTGK